MVRHASLLETPLTRLIRSVSEQPVARPERWPSIRKGHSPIDNLYEGGADSYSRSIGQVR